jgi:hypothetical protein
MWTPLPHCFAGDSPTGVSTVKMRGPDPVVALGELAHVVALEDRKDSMLPKTKSAPTSSFEDASPGKTV